MNSERTPAFLRDGVSDSTFDGLFTESSAAGTELVPMPNGATDTEAVRARDPEASRGKAAFEACMAFEEEVMEPRSREQLTITLPTRDTFTGRTWLMRTHSLSDEGANATTTYTLFYDEGPDSAQNMIISVNYAHTSEQAVVITSGDAGGIQDTPNVRRLLVGAGLRQIEDYIAGVRSGISAARQQRRERVGGLAGLGVVIASGVMGWFGGGMAHDIDQRADAARIAPAEAALERTQDSEGALRAKLGDTCITQLRDYGYGNIYLPTGETRESHIEDLQDAGLCGDTRIEIKENMDEAASVLGDLKKAEHTLKTNRKNYYLDDSIAPEAGGAAAGTLLGLFAGTWVRHRISFGRRTKAPQS